MIPFPPSGEAAPSWPSSQWTEQEIDHTAVARLMTELGLGRPVARILVGRGYSTPQSAADFLSPRLAACLLPDALPGISQAADVIDRHLAAKSPIIVFGDFDTDGMTAATILHTALRRIGGRASIFIPDRIHEGCGVTPNAFGRCLREHPDTRLVVTVDCAITRESVCTDAAARGVELVVTDHHENTLAMSSAVAACVNPCLPGTPEALRHLCGAGVAFKLAHELARRHFASPQEGAAFMRALTALAAVGTIGDLVPLVGENRIIASRGLDILNRPPHGELAGLRALRNVVGIRGVIDASALAFVLVPRINAAGRVGNPRVAIDLLSAPDSATALPLARQLAAFNNLRRQEEAAAVQAAQNPDAEVTPAIAGMRSATILYNPEWHPGIVGIVASRLSARHHLPTIVLTADEEPGLLRGSARCPEIPGLDLMLLLDQCRDFLTGFGGHRAAAGLTLPLETLPDFCRRFVEVCCEAERNLDMRPESRIEAWIRPEEANERLLLEIQKVGPFGTLNPPPLLGLRGLTLATSPLRFGRSSVNWRLDFQETRIPGILFNQEVMPFREGDRLDIVFRYNRDNFGSLQFLVRDIRPSATDLNAFFPDLAADGAMLAAEPLPRP